jgi:hypothetical protein
MGRSEAELAGRIVLQYKSTLSCLSICVSTIEGLSTTEVLSTVSLFADVHSSGTSHSLHLTVITIPCTVSSIVCPGWDDSRP